MVFYFAPESGCRLHVQGHRFNFRHHEDGAGEDGRGYLSVAHTQRQDFRVDLSDCRHFVRRYHSRRRFEVGQRVDFVGRTLKR